MSVLIVTSVGELVVDLDTKLCPRTSYNFLKLCKIKYYNGCLFHNVQKGFVAQTGDPTGTGNGGDSVYKLLDGDHDRFFSDEIHPELTRSKKGTVAMASAGQNRNASQFYITLRHDVGYLDGQHTVFGAVCEGFDTLAKINESYVDGDGRPFKDIRIKHTYVLYDPDPDPPQLAQLVPENSPRGKPKDETAEERLEDTWVPLDERLDPVQLEEVIRAKEAHSNALILKCIGDIPDAEIKPPENVLFRQGMQNANKDGCFKFDAPGYQARDRDQGAEQKSKGRDYVKNIQRGGNNRRNYDLVFDNDGATADMQDHRNVVRRKIQKSDGWRSDRNSRVKPHSDEKGGREVKESDCRESDRHKRAESCHKRAAVTDGRHRIRHVDTP